MEYNLVEVWLRKDPVRWIAGILAGLLAGAISMLVAMLVASKFGYEPLFPVKLVGTVWLGNSATDIESMQGAVVGITIFESVCALLGGIFAHFTGTNRIISLLAMGLVWGVFSWIFIWNLFMQSFTAIYAARIPSGAVFPVCIAFGLALASVSVFDQLFRLGSKSKH